VISPTPTFPVFQIALDYIENEAPTYQTGFDTWDFGDPIENASLESGKLLLSNARISLDQFNFSSDRFAVEFELRLLEGDMYSDCFFESDNGQGGDLKKSMLARYYHGGLGETFLQTWGYGKSESGRSFNFSETKTATVIVVGDQIASFVNGQLAGTTLHTDGSIVYTQQYLGARNITCEFDNFKFWNLDVVEFSTSTFNSKSEPTSIALSIAQLAEEFAEPIFTAIENREPDIQEDFNVDQPVESNWEFRGGDTKGKIEIENGVLLVHMFVKGNDDIVNEMMNEKMNFNNFVLKVDIDLTDLGTGHIMFNSRNNEKDENVSFEFDPTASASSDKWSVGLYNSNGSTNLAGGETTYTGKVTVTIISNGSEYAVFINDIPRTYIYDTGQSPGINGKEIDFKLYSDPESTVRFDNLKIWNLDGMEFSTAPTPTITPTPEPPAAFYEPIRAYIESQSPTFEDDFEVKNDLWGTTSEDIAISTLIDRGELNIFDNVELNEDNSSTNDRNGLGVTFPVNGLLSAKDFAIKFDFHMEYAGGSEADFGVVFRSKPFTHSSAGNSGYTIKFFSIGSWELIQNEDETLLATGSFGQKDMQFSGRVLLIVREQNLAVYMNEILLYDDSVLSVPETSITNGFTVEGTAVKFRFVEFWNLNGVEFSTPLSTPTSN
jgi:hypothetical protein